MEGCSAPGNAFDRVSSQLDLLHELLRSGSDEEDGPSPTQDTPASTPARDAGASSLSHSEDITNRLKEALHTLDRLDEAVDAFTTDAPLAGSESDGEQETSPWRVRSASAGVIVPGAPPGIGLQPGGLIMDGWFEARVVRRFDRSAVNFRQVWEKRYCVLTTDIVAGGKHVFVLACFRTQKVYQRKLDPDWAVQLAGAAVSVDAANSRAGSTVVAIQSAEELLLLRSTVSFVAHGWVTGMRGLQFTELLGWSERQLCRWLQIAGTSEETLAMLQNFDHLDGLYFASLGVGWHESTGAVAKRLQRNLGIGSAECDRIVHLLSALQATDVMSWLEDKDRELGGRYTNITAAVRFWRMGAKAERTNASSSMARQHGGGGAGTAPVRGLSTSSAKYLLAAEEQETMKLEKDARDGARVARRAARVAAAVRIQQVWRGVRDRTRLGTLMEKLGYFDHGVMDTVQFHAEWAASTRQAPAAVHASSFASEIAARMLSAAGAHDDAATKISAAYRGYSRRLCDKRQYLAAVGIQSAWRGRAVRVEGVLQRNRVLLERASIRRNIRMVWQHFFAWLGVIQRGKAVLVLRQRTTMSHLRRLQKQVVDEWRLVLALHRDQLHQNGTGTAERRRGTEQITRIDTPGLLQYGSGTRRIAAGIDVEPRRQQQQHQQVAGITDAERQRKGRAAAALIQRALRSRDPTLIEEALTSASEFPSLRQQCDNCRQLYRQLVEEFVADAKVSGDVGVVTKALSLARKSHLHDDVAQLEAWKNKLAEVKALIIRADKSGELSIIAQAVQAAQHYACFSKQVQALKQMKSLLADVHSLLNQALERQDPDDVNMAIKVAARFDSIRQSDQYRRLVALQQSTASRQQSPRRPPRPTPQRDGRSGGANRRRQSSPRGSARKRQPAGSGARGAHAAARSPARSARRPVAAASTPEMNTAGFGARPPAPPVTIRLEVAEMIAHCAEWVAQHGSAFEDTLRTKNAANPAFGFLTKPKSQEAAYYRQCLEHERGLAIVKMSKQSAPKRGGSARKANRKPRAGSGGTPMGGAARRAQDRPLHSRREFDRSGLSPPARLPASGRNPRLVFIWDMDETLIVFQSLVSGTYMKARQMNPKQHALGKKLGLQMMKLILWPLDNAMFFEQIEQVDKHHVKCLDKFDDHADLSRYEFNRDGFFVQEGRAGRPSCDLRKLAYRYRRICEVYQGGREATMPPEVLHELQECYEATDIFSNGWLTLTKEILHKVSQIPGAVNLVVSACQLTPTLAKAMIYQLDRFVPFDHVYSGSQIGKLACFNQIIARFGEGSQYIAVGDGLEEEEVSEELDLPFHSIKKISDLRKLDTLIDERLRYEHGR